MSANRNVGPVKRETGVNPVRCRRCKREVSGPFSFTVRKVQEMVRDGKKEDKKAGVSQKTCLFCFCCHGP